jgi:hypothetical protein
MNAQSRRKAARLGQQASELMLAAPQVVAHRLGRMAVAGARPSAKDRREFQRMGAEKLAAFGEAWQAMLIQMMKSNVQMTAAWLQGGWSAPSSRRSVPAPAPALHRIAVEWQLAALELLGQGMRPVHRRAVANARRLGRAARRSNDRVHAWILRLGEDAQKGSTGTRPDC